MLQDMLLVKKLECCETMASISDICTDKTGTLTQINIKLLNVWNYKLIIINDGGKDSLSNYFPESFHELFLMSCLLNANAQLRPDEQGSGVDISIL